MKKRWPLMLSVFNLLGYLIMLIVNTLANTLPINGKNTGELSDQYPNLFVPAGLTFSIWGVIYLLLLICVIYGFVVLGNKHQSNASFVIQINLLFFISCILNVAWIFAWHYQELPVSVAVMLLLLFTLIFIYHRLKIGSHNIPKQVRYLVHLPFSVYLGWISVATIANITALLVDAGWKGWGLSEEFWTIAMTFTGTLLAALMAILKRDIYYGMVIIWAYTGILIKRMTSATDSPVLIDAVFFFTGLLIVVLVVQFARRKAY
jgi:hypothetical protein